jgi:alkylation response protein AidB-like acyl-CoA dehydrogenase
MGDNGMTCDHSHPTGGPARPETGGPGRDERTPLARTLAKLGRVPLPGGGDTIGRFDVLAEVAAADLAIARLVEGHLDAVAICAEADRRPPSRTAGVWAADPPAGRLEATAVPGGWRLHGTKHWCSGARHLDAALVTAHADDGYRLFAVPLRRSGVTPLPGTWQAVGMRDSDTLYVRFDDVPVDRDAAVGPPGWYLDRRGFWIGGIGVAACWYGGAVGAVGALRAAVAARRDDHHGLAHLGAADALCTALRSTLRGAAHAIDDGIAGTALRTLAWRTRAAVERLASQVLDHAERGIGAGGLTADAAMARRAADLPVYLRQHHAERDLEALGRVVVAEP